MGDRSWRWVRRRLAVPGAVLVVAGCLPQPMGTAGSPVGDRTRSYSVLAIAGATASASSSLLGYGAGRGSDGNAATEWACGAARAAEAWWGADWGAVRDLANVRLKTGPLAGQANYVVEVSQDGLTFVPVTAALRNTTWNMESKPLPTGTRGRALRLHFHNDATASQYRFSTFEVEVSGAVPTPTPVPSTLPSATAFPSPTSSVPIVAVPNPGPGAARGRLVVNGVPAAGIAVTLNRTTGGTTNLTTDAQGTFQATGLAAGDYYAHYYNDRDRNKIGYWQSRTAHIDGTVGAAWPQIDLYQVGMTNVPAFDAHVSLPATFAWVRQVQPAAKCWFRVHSRPGRSFTLTYRSPALPGDATTYGWDGAGVVLDPANRYFWGFQWDAGLAGMGGNLYQAIYFNPR